MRIILPQERFSSIKNKISNSVILEIFLVMYV